MVMRGPGISPGSSFTYPASNVDVAPTILGLAGIDELAGHMDGRSIAPLLIDPTDPHVLPATRDHILRTRRVTEGKQAKTWRTFHPIEFYALGNHTWFGHLIDDVVSNTYRALRFVADPTYGDLLYAEFTSLKDYNFTTPNHYELFNMTRDPHQLVNLYYTMAYTAAQKADLQSRLLAHWYCAGATCP